MRRTFCRPFNFQHAAFIALNKYYRSLKYSWIFTSHLPYLLLKRILSFVSEYEWLLIYNLIAVIIDKKHNTIWNISITIIIQQSNNSQLMGVLLRIIGKNQVCAIYGYTYPATEENVKFFSFLQNEVLSEIGSHLCRLVDFVNVCIVNVLWMRASILR